MLSFYYKMAISKAISPIDDAINLLGNKKVKAGSKSDSYYQNFTFFLITYSGILTEAYTDLDYDEILKHQFLGLALLSISQNENQQVELERISQNTNRMRIMVAKSLENDTNTIDSIVRLFFEDVLAYPEPNYLLNLSFWKILRELFINFSQYIQKACELYKSPAY